MATSEVIKCSRHFMQKVLSNLCGIIFIKNFDTLEYLWVNDRYKDILGYEEDEIFMNTCEFTNNYIHPDDLPIIRERISYFQVKEHNEWSGVFRIRHKNGHWVWLYSRVRVFSRDEEGNPELLLCEAIDVFENFNTSNEITVLLKDRIKDGNGDLISSLTRREIEIIYHIAGGSTYTEIAEKLFISPETVNKHRKNALRKLKLKNIASLSAFAMEYGLASIKNTPIGVLIYMPIDQYL